MESKLRVGLSVFPPLVSRIDGLYGGFEVELWKLVAARAGIDHELTEYSFPDLLKHVENKNVDMALGGISIDEEREAKMDFSYPIFDSGMRIMVSNESFRVGMKGMVKSLFTKNVRNALIVLFLFVILSAHIIWFAEKDGGGPLAGEYIPGIFNAFWWGIVTVATVGYGDYVPVTLIGRAAATVVILVGLAVFGLYVGEISSSLTLNKIRSDIDKQEDLFGRKVGTVKGTVAVKTLRDIGARAVLFDTFEECCAGLVSGRVEAVVYDEPATHYFAAHGGRNDIHIAGDLFSEHGYGFAVQEGAFELRERINRAILALRESGEYDALYKKWFS